MFLTHFLTKCIANLAKVVGIRDNAQFSIPFHLMLSHIQFPICYWPSGQACSSPVAVSIFSLEFGGSPGWGGGVGNITANVHTQGISFFSTQVTQVDPSLLNHLLHTKIPSSCPLP